MWRHEGKKKKKGRARRKSSSSMASIAFPLGCNPGNALHRATTGPHWEMSVTRRVEESRGEGIKDGSTKNVNGGWRSPGPGPD